MDDKEWDEYVTEHEEGGFFHLSAWKHVVKKTYGFKPRYLFSEEAGIVKGILPLFEIQQATGRKLISVPFSTEGGLIADDEHAKNDLLHQAKDILEKGNLDYLELRQEKEIPDDGFDLKRKDYYHHMKLKLDKNPEVVWKYMDKKARNAVRKAEKLGVETDRGLKYLDDFYKIFSMNMRDLGTPVDSKRFFKEVAKQYPGLVDIIVAKLKGKVVGAIFLLKHKKTVKSEWASTLRKHFGINAAQAMYWRAIKDACESGSKVFDFGRSMECEGTYTFKKKFGAEPVQLHYKFLIRRGKMPDTRKTGKKRKIFAGIWKKMPLFLSNSLGPRFRRMFP